MQPTEQASLSPAQLLGCLDVLAATVHELQAQVNALTATVAALTPREEPKPKTIAPTALAMRQAYQRQRGSNRDSSFAGIARR